MEHLRLCSLQNIVQKISQFLGCPSFTAAILYTSEVTLAEKGDDQPMMNGMGTFGWLGMLINLLFWGGFLVLIAWAVVRIISAIETRSGNQPHTPISSPEDILKERFARGEIDAKEYEERLRILRGGGT